MIKLGNRDNRKIRSWTNELNAN